MKNCFRIIFFLITINLANAQTNRTIDSLYAELKKAKSDTTIIKLKIELGVQWRLFNLDSTMKYAIDINTLSEKADYDIGLAKSSYMKGMVYYMQGKQNEAIPYYEEAIRILEPFGNYKDLAKIYINTGVLYAATNNYTKALDVYYKALKILESINEEKIKAIALGNIGTIHYYNHEYDKAIEFSEKALAIDRKMDNTPGVAMHLGNIGSYYLDLGALLKEKGKEKESKEHYKKAISNLLEAYDLCEKIDNKSGMAINMGNIGSGLSDLGDTAKAFEYYEKAYRLDEELGNKLGMSRHLGNMGWMYLKLKDYKKAEKLLNEALELSKAENDHALLSKWHADLNSLYEQTGNFELALKHFKLGQAYKDSLFSIENAKKNLETEMNFEFQKKENAAKEESARQAIIRNVFIGGFVVVLLMGLLVLRSYSIKRKANKAISEQKELLEVKNKEITDSIHYAKRIQNAHLPSSEYISKKITELKNKS